MKPSDTADCRRKTYVLLKDKNIVRKGFTRYLGRASIYGVTPISEEMVRELLPSIDGTPSTPLSLRSYQRDYEE